MLNGLVSSLLSERRSGLPSHISARTSSDSPEEKDPADTEADDFDLDADLKPAADREYVSLKKADDNTDSASQPLEEE